MKPTPKRLRDMRDAWYDTKDTQCLEPRCKGVYIETSIHDDMDGIQHCDICNEPMKRYPNQK